MAVTYFGLCNADGTPTQSTSDITPGAAVWLTNYPTSQGGALNFTCPGTGNQVIKELSAMVHAHSGTCHLRIAIYNEALNSLKCQGTAEVTITGASDTWQGHLVQANMTPNPAVLVGGTKYCIVIGMDWSSGVEAATDHAHSNSSTSGVYNTNDETGGFAASLSPGGTWYCWPVRCGVEPEAAAAGILRQMMAHEGG